MISPIGNCLDEPSGTLLPLRNRANLRTGDEPTVPSVQSVSRQIPWLQCPQCAAPMKLRTAKQGRFAGRQFWGCSRFPSCSEILNIRPAFATWMRPATAPGFSSTPASPQASGLAPEELERLREKTRRATEESAAYIAAELAKAKLRRDRFGSSKPVGKSRSYRRRYR
ncbi:topoisomerase DNA-binding C4 zinc finger domain-containing protein [Mesorhizobium sp. M0435]|uniref:topoisomerase DNA-binding C4 zinc finger domain-containing protein n=1 Tax=Mesorhizobium sp. M0435 TaxID=2956944 RepID=UPI003335CF26